MVELTFHGAAETVTGSKYLLEADGSRALIDCGLFQGLKLLRERNWGPPPVDPSSVDCVVLTHAHIDHTGYLPRFVKYGFRGPVFATPATVELTELLLLDSAENQEEDAKYANKKGFARHKPALPLYERRDVDQALKLLRGVKQNEWFQATGPIWARYRDTGHLLGASMIEVEVRRDGRPPLRILFSGDVGRYGAPLYFDPSPPTACDILICEATYGDRDHSTKALLDQLEKVVLDSIARGGVMVVPSFAVGRAQQLIYLTQVLIEARRIPRIPIYLDSPMAIDATRIYRRYSTHHDFSEGPPADGGLAGPNVHFTRTSAESKRINGVAGPALIISSSGMMVGGRILHHLKQRLPDPRNTGLIGGFMAEGTRGRELKQGAVTLRIHGQDVPVRAAVVELTGLSGHAGRSELLRWLKELPPPRTTFLTHGEPPGLASLGEELRTARGWNVVVPSLGSKFDLEAAK